MEKSFRNSGGFTLIEVLVSLTIMALITGVAFSGLSIGIDSWHKGSRKIQELDRRVSVERLIQRQVALADPQSFQGEPHALEFTSTYSLANGSGDPVRVRYSFDSARLVYQERPASEFVSGHSNPIEDQALGNFSSFDLRYLATDSLGNNVWADAWIREGLPLVVQARIDGDVMTIPMENHQ